MIGTCLGGRYEILELISEGGMAIVYKAHCQTLARIVAVKVLKDIYSRDISFVQRFRTEALAAAQLSHPNLVNIYDVGQDGNVYYIVMEYIEGKNLKELIKSDAPFTIDQAINVSIMVLDGLHHAHEKGIIHRDIKPQNIIITPEGIAKVADFGIAKAPSTDTITFGRDIQGSVHYISPEQAKGEPTNRTTDIYSVACIMYEMLSGVLPFEAESTITVALKHIHEDPVPLSELKEDIPPVLENLIMVAMSKVPSQRFQSALEMRNALVELRDNNTGNHQKASAGNGRIILPSLNPKPEVVKRKFRTTRIIVILTILLGFVSGFFFVNDGLFGREIEVPEIRGSLIKDAKDLLAANDLKISIIAEQNSNDVAKDHIISQNPLPSAKVKAGRTIEVIISTGEEMFKIPGVVGLTRTDGEALIKNEGFKVGKVNYQFDDRFAENTITSQSPEANEVKSRDTKVDIRVSTGKAPNKVKVPKLIGLTQEAAEKALTDSKLTLGVVEKKQNTTVSPDRVFYQSIDADVLVDEQTAVGISINSSQSVLSYQEIKFTLPEDSKSHKVEVKVKDQQGERIVYNEQHQGGQPVTLAISFNKSGIAEVFIDGANFKTFQLIGN